VSWWFSSIALSFETVTSSYIHNLCIVRIHFLLLNNIAEEKSSMVCTEGKILFIGTELAAG
jgi:hypothetical protein